MFTTFPAAGGSFEELGKFFGEAADPPEDDSKISATGSYIIITVWIVIQRLLDAAKVIELLEDRDDQCFAAILLPPRMQSKLQLKGCILAGHELLVECRAVIVWYHPAIDYIVAECADATVMPAVVQSNHMDLWCA